MARPLSNSAWLTRPCRPSSGRDPGPQVALGVATTGACGAGETDADATPSAAEDEVSTASRNDQRLSIRARTGEGSTLGARMPVDLPSSLMGDAARDVDVVVVG